MVCVVDEGTEDEGTGVVDEGTKVLGIGCNLKQQQIQWFT